MRPHVLPILVTLCLAAAPALRAQDAEPQDTAVPQEAAKMLPAETGSFIQIDDIAQTRADLARDPVFCEMLKMLPHARHRAAWAQMQTMLDLNGEQIVDRYLGSRVVIVGPRPGWGQPMTIMMRVKPDDSKRLVSSLALEPMATSGSFKVFSTHDNQTRIAVSSQWVSVARTGKHDDYMRAMLGQCGNGRTLSEDPEYRDWMARLPQERSAVAFFRGHPTGHSAAVAIVNKPAQLSIHYVGRIDNSNKLFDMMGDGAATQFGPLPRETIAAATINLLNRTPDDIEMLDRLLAPRSYEKDIADKIAAPLLVFAGSPMPDNDEAALPAVGGAIWMRDESVAQDLSLLIDNAMLVMSVTASKWGAPPIITQSVKHGDKEYRIAEVGVVLAKRFGRDELIRVRLSYGKVGNWYLVASNEKFFNRCLDAMDDPSLRLESDPSTKCLAHCKKGRSIATVFIMGDQTKALAMRWIDLLDNSNAPQFDPQTDAQIAEFIGTVPALFTRYSSLSAQFRRDDNDENLVLGQVNLVRK